MTSKRLGKTAAVLALGLAALALTAPSFAAELAAVPAQWLPPGGAVGFDEIPMWAYIDVSPDTAATYTCPSAPVAWTPGPTLTATAGGSLDINIKNCLSEPVSMIIPGQIKGTSPVTFTDGQGRTRVQSLDKEVGPGADDSFSWANVKEGTYLYYTAAHPAVGVQMGLYGALAVSGGSYPTVAAEKVILLSEIDPALHDAVDSGDYGTAAYPSTFDYHPRYYLINGQASPNTATIALDTGSDVLLRILNAGLRGHSPTLGGGLYMSLIAEDGNLYPFPLEQYGVELPPQKVIDAVLNIGADGTYALYDRSLGLMNDDLSGGGMYVSLSAGAAAGAPTVVNDSYSVDEDAVLTATAGDLSYPGVLDNDGAGADVAVLLIGPSAGTLTSGLAADGSFTYTPDSNFNGSDSFTYVANDGLGGPNSVAATVSITVGPINDPPTTVADAYDAVEGEILSVAAPGVLGNDSDVDGDALTVTTTPVVAPTNGSLALNSDGSFDYTPSVAAPGSDTFTYEVCDPSSSCVNGVVDITIIAFVNTAPVAVDDTVNTPQNTVKPINVISNDYDPDGTIDATSVVLGCGLATCTTSAGGTVVNSGGGIVTFTPKNPGYRGTDTFTYTVKDNLGDISNVATVRVNVTR